MTASNIYRKIASNGPMRKRPRVAELQRANPRNLLAYLPLTQLCSIMAGEGQLKSLNNERYPSIRPTTVREEVATKEGIES